MAHNINFNEQTGRHSFFSVKEKAWNGLGQVVEGYPTSTEAIEYAGLNYAVEKESIYIAANNADGERQTLGNAIETHVATIRKDTGAVLGIVGKDYEIVQNKDAFTLFDSIVDGEGIIYETAGALGKGYGKWMVM